ncbi:MAG: prefoldin subunit beta [Candidatus Aenigmarchaeota archaeon]|nr:prefoldin subunit beta [Candidatus Aenigmarchaeota archaeon]
MDNKELQELAAQLQLQNQQIQTLMIQKQTLEIQIREIDSALMELKKNESTEIFKTLGPVLIKTDKNDIEKSLEEQKEEAELRIKTIEKQESIVKKRMESNQKSLKSMLPDNG